MWYRFLLQRILSALVVALLTVSSAWAQLGDVTNTITYLGIPTQGQYPTSPFPRNMWTVKSFSSRLYLGSGDFDGNAGPVFIRTFTPSTGLFNVENGGVAVQEEQISAYVTLGGNLFFPGIDPRGAPAYSNWYSFSPVSGWSTHANIPGGIHTFDLYVTGAGVLLSAGAASPQSGVQWSTDGNTWYSATCNGGTCPEGRYFKFFSINGVIYVSAYNYPNGINGETHLYEYVTSTNNMVQISTSITTAMMPGISRRVIDPTPFLSGLAYIAGVGVAPSDQLAVPQYLMYTTALGTVSQVPLPLSGTLPQSILVRNGALYLLHYKSDGAGGYWNTVGKTTNLVNWTNVLTFRTIPSKGIVRSFEHLDGYFYFGIGTLQTDLSTASGYLLRIAYTP